MRAETGPAAPDAHADAETYRRTDANSPKAELMYQKMVLPAEGNLTPSTKIFVSQCPTHQLYAGICAGAVLILSMRRFRYWRNFSFYNPHGLAKIV